MGSIIQKTSGNNFNKDVFGQRPESVWKSNLDVCTMLAIDYNEPSSSMILYLQDPARQANKVRNVGKRNIFVIVC